MTGPICLRQTLDGITILGPGAESLAWGWVGLGRWGP